MIFRNTFSRKELLGCMLCENPKCSAVCPHMDCGKILRSIWFDNENGAALALPEDLPCYQCDAPCEKKCPAAGKTAIKDLMIKLHETWNMEAVGETVNLNFETRPSLEADLCGVKLENPFILSSSVVASNYEMCARAFEMGWAGASFKTVSFLDIHEASPRFSAIRGDNGTMIGFKNIEQLSDHSVAENMEIFRRLKENYPTKVIIASIMGRDEEEWRTLARLSEEADADVLELNFSCPHMSAHGMGSDIGQHPELVEAYTRAACEASKLPVLAKLTPNTGNMVEAAEAALRGGAKGLAAINTIKSITNINIHTYVSSPAVHGQSAVGGYSGQAVKPIALRFISELGQWNRDKDLHISGMGGIETWKDALEFILLGAGSIQITTAVMQYGYRIIDDLIDGLQIYMKEKGVTSVEELKGLGLDSIFHPDSLERDTILYPKFLRDKCLGCGRCVISCRDGGHQALILDEKDEKPRMNPKKCVGCQLCVLVCPNEAIVSSTHRVDKSGK